MGKSDHCRAPEDSAEWDRPDFLFPTYEDDNLLCKLDDDLYEQQSQAGAANPVESEDVPLKEIIQDSVLNDEKFRRSITSGHH